MFLITWYWIFPPLSLAFVTNIMYQNINSWSASGKTTCKPVSTKLCLVFENQGRSSSSRLPIALHLVHRNCPSEGESILKHLCYDAEKLLNLVPTLSISCGSTWMWGSSSKGLSDLSLPWSSQQTGCLGSFFFRSWLFNSFSLWSAGPTLKWFIWRKD